MEKCKPFSPPIDAFVTYLEYCILLWFPSRAQALVVCCGTVVVVVAWRLLAGQQWERAVATKNQQLGRPGGSDGPWTMAPSKHVFLLCK